MHGRFDTIPMDVNKSIIQYAECCNGEFNPDTIFYDIMNALSESSDYKFIKLIYLITLHKYGKIFELAYPKMLLDLSKQFEGECEKNILSNDFIDLGMRYLMLYLSGKTDKPYHILAIKNFWMAEYSAE